MLKTRKNSILLGLLLTMSNKNTFLNKDSLFTYGRKSLPYINNLYFTDLAFLESPKSSKNKVTYVMHNTKNYFSLNIHLLNANKINSLSSSINILDWYERELSENTGITVTNIKDIRNLILPYSYKYLKNSYYRKQNYKFLFTNLSKKNLKLNDKMKIIL